MFSFVMCKETSQKLNYKLFTAAFALCKIIISFQNFLDETLSVNIKQA